MQLAEHFCDQNRVDSEEKVGSCPSSIYGPLKSCAHGGYERRYNLTRWRYGGFEDILKYYPWGALVSTCDFM